VVSKIVKIEGLNQADIEFLKANLFFTYGLYHDTVSILENSRLKHPVVKSADRPGNRSPKPDGVRLQAVY